MGESGESDDERLDRATVLELTGGRFDDALFESLARGDGTISRAELRTATAVFSVLRARADAGAAERSPRRRPSVDAAFAGWPAPATPRAAGGSPGGASAAHGGGGGGAKAEGASSATS